jgi:hypothetical protein
VSTLSGSASVARRVEERNDLTLFQLSNVASPLAAANNDLPTDPSLYQYAGPLDEEEAYDNGCYNENGGASDSEDEPDSDI